MTKLYQQITAFLDSTVDAAVVLDAERRVRHYNPAYQALTGLRGAELGGALADPPAGRPGSRPGSARR